MTSSVSSYLNTYTAVGYTYSSRQYCATYRQYYYSRLYTCVAKVNIGGPIGGAVGGVIAVVLVIAVCYCWCKKKKNAELT